MGLRWYIIFSSDINKDTGLPTTTFTTPIPQEHRKWLSGHGYEWFEEIFEPIGFANDDRKSCSIDCMDMDAFPEWEDIKEQMNGAFECEEEYESFKAAFRYFHDADISLKLLLTY